MPNWIKTFRGEFLNLDNADSVEIVKHEGFATDLPTPDQYYAVAIFGNAKHKLVELNEDRKKVVERVNQLLFGYKSAEPVELSFDGRLLAEKLNEQLHRDPLSFTTKPVRYGVWHGLAPQDGKSKKGSGWVTNEGRIISSQHPAELQFLVNSAGESHYILQLPDELTVDATNFYNPWYLGQDTDREVLKALFGKDPTSEQVEVARHGTNEEIEAVAKRSKEK